MSATDDDEFKIKPPTRAQWIFIDYTLFILVDLTILNLFDEYGKHVHIESFTISLLAATLLQLLLRFTLKLEHRMAAYFNKQGGKAAKIKRVFAAWLLLLVSKFVILKIIDVVFGDLVEFHSIVGFIIVVIAIVVVERQIMRIYRMLGHDRVTRLVS